jgi:hypothetical protein
MERCLPCRFIATAISFCSTILVSALMSQHVWVCFWPPLWERMYFLLFCHNSHVSLLK